jgi:hypothetical protein
VTSLLQALSAALARVYAFLAKIGALHAVARCAMVESVYPRGAELFVLDGSFEDEHRRYETHTWMRVPTHFAHRPKTQQGCELYVKEGGFAYLRNVSAC